jgi:predicted RND superfamily exporter protein
MGKAIFHNFIKYIIIASIVIILFLFLMFRNVKKILCALIPVATGLLVMFGTMGWSRMEFNLFNIIASILVIGLSVDLGIFMVSKVSEGYDHNTSMAVFLGGMTSLVGMGALALASHPALYSLGITVLLGMCGAIPSALFVIPAFYGPVTVRA